MLDAPSERVWASIVTMEGVNHELGPYLRMTLPREARHKTIDDVPLGRVAFHSWILLGGVVPMDRHALKLVELTPGVGFLEQSTSWLQRAWRHERRLTPVAPGRTRIVDRLVPEPRIASIAPLARRLVGAIFRHRHRRLHAAFGGSFEG